MRLDRVAMYVGCVVSVVLPAPSNAAPDPVAELRQFIDEEITIRPAALGKIFLRIVEDDKGQVVRTVDILQPYRNLRPNVRESAQKLKWQSYEEVRIRITAGYPTGFSFVVCRPAFDPEEC